MGTEYKKILLCNGAHLGDLILSTAVLPVIKSAWPNVKIGFLIGSWALPVIHNHKDVEWIHLFDHPQLNRSSASQKEKKRQGNRTWHTALTEIHEQCYDLAIDLYYFYKASSGLLLSKAEVPKRVGFWGSPAHFTFTDRFFWDHRYLHMVENHGMILRKLGISEQHLNFLKPTLHYHSSFEPYRLPEPCKKKNYLLIHMGVGDYRRQWNKEAWKILIQKLKGLDLPLVFIGQGKKEQEWISELSPQTSHCFNLCNKLSWRQLVSIVENARMLIGLESMGGHLAAALETPSVVIYGQFSNIRCWKPYHASSQVVTSLRDVPKPKSTKLRFDAIHWIQPEDVFQKILLGLESINSD